MDYFIVAVLACLALVMIARKLACSAKDSRGELLASLGLGAISVPVLLSITYFTLYTDLPLTKEESIWVELGVLGISTATVMAMLKTLSWGLRKVIKMFRRVHSRFGKITPSTAYSESGN